MHALPRGHALDGVTMTRLEEGIAAPAEIDLVLRDLRQRRGQVPVPARRRLRDARALDGQRFREEFEARVELGCCPLHESSSLSSLYPQPRRLLPLATVSP